MSSITLQKNTDLVKNTARELGFDFCGISQAGFLEEEAPRLENWLKNGHHGKMQYMENHFDKRLDPTLLVPGAKSVISLALNYAPEQDLAEQNPEGYKLAKYAYGEDYHYVIKWKLKELVKQLQQEIGAIEGRVFVDSAPVMERSWAEKSGLGWIGKHTLLINKGAGSFFFLAEVISDLELVPDGPVGDYCGTCTRCLDACPTDAIFAPQQLDASKCISYLTIELKEELPSEFQGQLDDWIFGCDICQDVCPWNRFSKPHTTPELAPHPELEGMTRTDWHEITEDVFRKLFRKSPVKRTKLAGLKRNIEFVRKS